MVVPTNAAALCGKPLESDRIGDSAVASFDQLSIIAPMLKLAAWGLALLLVLPLGGCGPITFTIGTAPSAKLEHTVVIPADRRGADRIAMIDVTGLMVNASKRGILYESENPVSLLHEKLQQVRQDRRVKAVILRINSPGGTVTASDTMYRQVQRFREETGKPVIALMMDVAASGGYYIACASDTIIAHPTTITGSVGVILQTISVKPALDRIGIHAEAFTSGPNKDAGSPLSHLTEEHRQVLMTMVDDFYQRFVAVVRENRPTIAAEAFETATDGRVMTGERALAMGMVDEVDDLFGAFETAKRMAKLSDAALIVYHRRNAYVGSPFAMAPGAEGGDGTLQINLLQLNVHDVHHVGGASVGFLYLWQPPIP